MSFQWGGKGEGGGEGGEGGGAGRDSCCRYLIVLMECNYNIGHGGLGAFKKICTIS